MAGVTRKNGFRHVVGVIFMAESSSAVSSCERGGMATCRHVISIFLRGNMRRFLLFAFLLFVLLGCSEQVDGTSLQSTEASIESMSEGLGQEEAAQFKKDVNTIVFSLPPFQAPAHLDGMTRSQIHKEAALIRFQSEMKSTEERIEMLRGLEKEYAAENAIRDDAAAELARIRITLQQAPGGGGIGQASVGCVMHIQNGSRHTLSRLWWRSESASGDSMIVPQLKPGEERTLDDCGMGAFLVENNSSLGVNAVRAKLATGGMSLEPWERPEDRARLIRPEEELPGLEAKLSELKRQLESTR